MQEEAVSMSQHSLGKLSLQNYWARTLCKQETALLSWAFGVILRAGVLFTSTGNYTSRGQIENGWSEEWIQWMLVNNPECVCMAGFIDWRVVSQAMLCVKWRYCTSLLAHNISARIQKCQQMRICKEVHRNYRHRNQILKKLNKALTYEPGTLLLDIHSRKLKAYFHVYIYKWEF